MLTGCSLSSGTVEARSNSRSKVQKPSAVVSTSSAPAQQDWRVGSPASYKNLTLFPVLSNSPRSIIELITLDEGLKSRKVTITELGADGRSRAIDTHRSSDRAEVNRLALTNASGKPLLLIAGEMILGGKQDRIVGHDCIIEASSTPVPLDVFCVEHGRWSGGPSFGHSTSNTGGGGAGNGRGEEVVSVRAEPAPMALPKIREKAEAAKSQGDVWRAVSETVDMTTTSSSTGTLNSVYEDKKVNKQINDFERAFKDKFSSDDIVGVIAAVGGKVVSADVFTTHSLFHAYWPKMLKSYALQAVSTSSLEEQVSKNEAQAFLSRVQGSSVSGGHEGVYRLAENQSSSDASFELEYVNKASTLVHFNRVAKK
jgi:hypothetical protein